MKQSLIRVLAVALAVMMMLAGCSQGSDDSTNGSGSQGMAGDGGGGSSSGDRVEVVIWHTFTDHHAQALEHYANEFNDSQDFARVIVQGQPLQDFDAKVMQAVRNQNGPSMILHNTDPIPNYLADGLVADIGKYIDDPEIGIPGYKDSLPEGLYNESVQFDVDGLYFVPINITAPIVFYNKTMFDELNLTYPTTWDQFETVAETIYNEHGIPAFGYDDISNGIRNMMIQNGSDYIDLYNKEATFNTPESVEIFEFFKDMVDKGYIKLKPDDYFSSEFGGGGLASYVGSVAGYQFVESAVDDKFEFATAPFIQGKNNFWTSWSRGAIIFTADEDTEKACYLFTKYFIQPEITAEWCVTYAAITPYYEAAQQQIFQDFVAENPGIRTIYESLDTLTFLPSFKGAVTLTNECEKAILEFCAGTKTAQQALDDAAANSTAEMQS